MSIRSFAIPFSACVSAMAVYLALHWLYVAVIVHLPQGAWRFLLDRIAYAGLITLCGSLVFLYALPMLFDRWKSHRSREGGAQRESESTAADSAKQTERDSWLLRSRRGIWIGPITGILLALIPAGILVLVNAAGIEQPPSRNTRAEFSMTYWRYWMQTGFAVLITPTLEEIFYRGALQHFLHRSGVASAIAILISSILFVLVHATHTYPVMIVASLAFGIVFWRFGLIPTILAHISYNAVIWILYLFSRMEP